METQYPNSAERLYFEDPVEKAHLSDYLYVVRKHLKVILACFVIVVTLVTISTLAKTPIYRATARMVIDKEIRKSPLTGEQLEYESYMSETLSFQTHFEQIKSRVVLAMAREGLDLKDIAGNGPPRGVLVGLANNVRKNFRKLSLMFNGDATKAAEQAGEAAAIDEPKVPFPSIDVSQIKDTRLVAVSAEHENPEVAQAAANALCKAYVTYNMDQRLQATQDILSWLADEMGKMKQKLEESEARFLAFKEQEKIFSISGKQSIDTQNIAGMNSEYVSTRAKRLDLEARIAELRKVLAGDEMTEFPPAFARSELLTSLYQQQALLAIELKKNQKVYKSKHPEIVEIQTKLEQTRERFRSELGKVLVSLRSDYSILEAREKALQEALEQYETDALQTNKKEAQYAILEREVNVNKELYNMMSTKIKEYMISRGMGTANVRFVEPALKPTSPFKPDKRRSILLGIVFGLMGGVGIAFFLEYLDRTIKKPEDLERHFQFPVLAVVQNIPRNKRQR